MNVPAQRNWLTPGDLNGFFGLVVDNLSVMAFLAASLIGIFQFPAEIIFTRMLPGTAFGVLLGDLAYTVLARKLARRSGRGDVTAMPLGLDAPSTIGMALLVLGPAFIAFKKTGLDADAAAIATWHLGMAATVVMGLFKFVLAFFGERVQRWIPRAGLLGSIAGIALMLMGFLPIIEIFQVPIVGLSTLGIVLYALLAKGRLPIKLPSVLVAFLFGTVLYYVLGPLGVAGPGFHAPGAWQWRIALPWPTLGFIDGFTALGPYLALVLPFALLTVIGGINVTESARAAGDDYRTRDILLVEALSTLAAGICGGVAQTTPYIGQPAYKNMGARSSYTLLTGLFIGLGGMLGLVSNLVELVPLAVLAPILVFVAIEITVQAFQATPSQHAAAVVFAFFPEIARLVTIKLLDPTLVPPPQFAQAFAATDQGLSQLAVIVVLGNGFIITSMLWASFLAAMIDRQLRRASAFLLVCAALTLFGIIHSAQVSGAMYWPWSLSGLEQTIAWQFTGAYLLLAVIVFALSWQRQAATIAGDSIA